MNLLVGCPFYRREWVLPSWLRHVEAACARARVKPTYIFACDPRDPGVAVVQESGKVHASPLEFMWCEEDLTQPLDRFPGQWTHDRYCRMAYLRNQLLTGVRRIAPDLFLSLDSDILLHPDALERMIGLVADGQYAAAGTKVYLDIRHPRYPNYGQLGSGGGLVRSDTQACFPVDILMAVKLMTPPAYQVDYEGHPEGEDIGWAAAVARAGLRLVWDGGVASKHVMSRSQLYVVDPRIGY